MPDILIEPTNQYQAREEQSGPDVEIQVDVSRTRGAGTVQQVFFRTAARQNLGIDRLGKLVVTVPGMCRRGDSLTKPRRRDDHLTDFDFDLAANTSWLGNRTNCHHLVR